MKRNPLSIRRALICLMLAAVFLLTMVVLAHAKGDRAPDEEPIAKKVDFTFEKNPATVRVRLDRNVITTAEQVHLTIEATVGDGYELAMPALGDDPGGFTVLDKRLDGPALGDQGRLHYTLTASLEPFLAGDYTLPSMMVSWRQKGEPGGEEAGRIETGPINVVVLSVLEGEKPEPKPNFGPLDLPFRWDPVWIGIAVATVLLLAGLIFWLRSMNRRRAIEAEIRRVAAHELALRRLRRIRPAAPEDHESVKVYYLDLSSILREYIENRFGFRAPSRTTEEFLEDMRHGDSFQPDHKRLLDAFLIHCDLVKFADHRALPDEMAAAMATCESFVSATKNDEILVVDPDFAPGDYMLAPNLERGEGAEEGTG